MREDVHTHQPFSQYFLLDILATTTKQLHADMLEAAFIKQYNATGPNGYNDLDGAPSTSQRGHAIARGTRRKDRA